MVAEASQHAMQRPIRQVQVNRVPSLPEQQSSNAAGDITNDITLSIGQCVTMIGGRYIASLASALTKQLDAVWTAGNNAGGRFSGVALANQTYHLFALYNPSTGAVDAGFDSSVVAANRPAGWAARRVGSIIRASAAIVPFRQYGNYFELGTVAPDISVQVPTGGALYGVTVPTGLSVQVRGILSPGWAESNLTLAISAQSPSQTPLIPALHPASASFVGMAGGRELSNGTSAYATASELLIMTNTSGQIYLRRTGTYTATSASNWQTLGWFDQDLLRGS